jgi:hypothetical protein
MKVNIIFTVIGVTLSFGVTPANTQTKPIVIKNEIISKKTCKVTRKSTNAAVFSCSDGRTGSLIVTGRNRGMLKWKNQRGVPQAKRIFVRPRGGKATLSSIELRRRCRTQEDVCECREPEIRFSEFCALDPCDGPATDERGCWQGPATFDFCNMVSGACNDSFVRGFFRSTNAAACAANLFC